MLIDHYGLLNLTPDATAEQIHHAYRLLARLHHPDRDPSPAAAFKMAAINDAYTVLSNAGTRRKYDQQRNAAGQSRDLKVSILKAARETVSRRGWTVIDDAGISVTLKQSSRQIRVFFVNRLTDRKLVSIARSWPGFSAVLAVEIETLINFPPQTAVIDLMHSRHHGAPFPDERYKPLFTPFL